jgi:hypothetical protein
MVPVIANINGFVESFDNTFGPMSSSFGKFSSVVQRREGRDHRFGVNVHSEPPAGRTTIPCA